jgi:hypothetical protein
MRAASASALPRIIGRKKFRRFADDEAEWLACVDPSPMLDLLKRKASDRKLRLFAVASCRGSSAWALFPNDQCREAINFAEQFADGYIGWKQLWDAREAISVTKSSVRKMHSAGYSWQMGDAWAHVAADVAMVPVVVPWFPGTCGLLRDVFGNPFRPVTFDPSWLTSDVLALAEGIYQDRAFDRMPILADALQDAGCGNEDILNHCRQPGEHVRGCWVVDLLTARK